MEDFPAPTRFLRCKLHIFVIMASALVVKWAIVFLLWFRRTRGRLPARFPRRTMNVVSLTYFSSRKGCPPLGFVFVGYAFGAIATEFLECYATVDFDGINELASWMLETEAFFIEGCSVESGGTWFRFGSHRFFEFVDYNFYVDGEWR